MSELAERKANAIEAVTRQFATTGTIGEPPEDAYIAIAGKRIGLQVSAIEQRGSSERSPTRLGLRFDRVATRLIGRLRDALHESVPDDCTVMLTVTAPIRLPLKTAAALEERIRGCLARAPARAAIADTIHGNEVRIRLVGHAISGTSKLVGFVHNPDTDAGLLLDLTCSLFDCVGAQEARRAAAALVGDQWLVIASDAWRSHIAAYRHAWSQLSIPTGFAKVLLVPPDGQVEPLSG